MDTIAELIDRVIQKPDDEANLNEVAAGVHALTGRYPISR
jgi:glycine/serine hydroxymethyltransferase